MDTLELLQSLIRIDTTPGKPVTQAVCLIKRYLEQNGIAVTVSGRTRGEENLIAWVPGGNKPSIALHAHLDTWHEGDVRQWRMPPFHAAIQNGYIVGRGALDCKGPAAAFAQVLVNLKHQKNLPQNVMLLLTCNEEAGEHDGVKWLLDTGRLPFLPDYVIGEGGGVPIGTGSKGYMTLQTGERGYAEYMMQSFEQGKTDAQFSRMPVFLKEVFRSKGSLDKESLFYFFGNVQSGKQLERSLRYDRMQVQKGEGSVLRVWHSEMTSDRLKRKVQKLHIATENLKEIAFTPFTASAVDTPLCRAIEYVCRKKENKKLLPFHSTGYSDNRFFRIKGIPVYGFFPLSERDYPSLMHQANECLCVESLRMAIQTIEDVIMMQTTKG